MKKQITLFGGSGSMGFQTFKVLWEKRESYRLCLLLRPSDKNKKKFRPYIKKAGQDELKIIWGDAIDYKAVKEAVRGTEYVLDTMAVISPLADYYPERAKKVNTDCISNIVKAIEEEPGGSSRIKFAYTGTVAETGDRLPPLHWGRTGDPLKPSIFDYYAVTKIAGERIVIESEIQHWVSLRVTGIMPSTFKDLSEKQDPISYHMPLNACMENITDRDSGLGMANVVQISDDSDFWRKVYNMAGGPHMRLPAFDFYKKSYSVFGIRDITTVFERNWFATQNFHMQYYIDSHILNDYLHFWRDSTDDWITSLLQSLPVGMKIFRKLAGSSSMIQNMLCKQIKRRNLKLLENHRNGTLYWRQKGNTKRIDAFYGGTEAYDGLPGWDTPLPDLCYGDDEPVLLDHGYDESKKILTLTDLKKAAEFRGGRCLSKDWGSNMFKTLEWECAFGHKFEAKPNTVLKGGHWCPDCIAPDWDFKKIAAENHFFNQVIEPFSAKIPDYPIRAEDLNDIRGADKTNNSF